MNKKEQRLAELEPAARKVVAVFPARFEVTGYDGEGEGRCLYCDVVAEVDPAWQALADIRSAWFAANPCPQHEYIWKRSFTSEEKKDYQRMDNRVRERQKVWQLRLEQEAPLPELSELFLHKDDCPFALLVAALDGIGG